ncbi:hypothetical protein MA16_Dca005910 [Dendrobium catenatum]|uniref:Uncharacterized protein n=1 Tax=Dendrobium catenatum TaxID=906689 RepID=A0A2I0WJN3_9ASPA|nr:hypothetical protein MA16_Dca005910 [Dendrobium catenatum]
MRVTRQLATTFRLLLRAIEFHAHVLGVKELQQDRDRVLHFSFINLQQKVVLKLSMEDAKKRSKAMQCAVGMHGVLSVSHEGDKMTVVGEGIDSVALTVGYYQTKRRVVCFIFL